MRWPAEVGINHVGAYQVSGRPFASASINASNAHIIEFPFVTRWVTLINKSGNTARVGFSELGVSGSNGENYFTLEASGAHSGYGKMPAMEMKISNLWLYSPAKATNIDVVAGLTSINRNKTSGSTGPSWSGSIGAG
jgi:hypothetical protein